VKHNKILALSLTLVLGVGLSCDSPTRPPTTGNITLTLVSGTNGAPMIVSARDSKIASAVTGGGAVSNVVLDGIRVTVTGPTTKTASTNSPAGGFFDLTITDLAPGSYTVTVEGLVGGAVDHFGQTTGVSVTAGNSTPASITFNSFQPLIPASTVVDTSDVLHFTINYGAVANATGYIVAWSTSPAMTGAQTKSVTGTSTDITVADEGKYYVTVKAVNAVVTTGGVASPAKTVYVFQGVATVTVTPAAPTIAAGATQQMTAEARDADNNVVTITNWLWLSDNQAAARVSPTGLVTGISGGQATIYAVAKGTPGNTTITVGALSPNKLAFSIQPTTSVAGDALSPAVQVEIQDANGNRVTNARDGVTIAIANNAGGGTLTGTKVVNAIDGIASFTGLWINKTGTGYTLSASSGALIAATSSGFNISAGAPAKLAFSQQPTGTQGNVVITPFLTVTIADQFDNATTATNPVTVSLGSNPWKTVFSAGGALSGTPTRAAIGGVATFNNLRVDKPAPGYSVVATSPGLTGAVSTGFNINLAISQLAVSSGGSHTCAIATGGTYCWGANGSGQLGALTGNTQSDSVAALVRSGQTFVSVTAGSDHSCGLTAAGAAFCWGYNGNGQLGDNTQTSTDVPVAVAGGHVFAQIDAGVSHTCGVTAASGTAAEDRQVYCWGNNANGRLGNNSTTQSLVPVRAAEPLQTTTRASQVSAGGNHTCARAINGNAYCWGYGYWGAIGDGQVTTSGGGVDRPVPTLVAGGLLWTSVTAGYVHSCGVTAANAGRCWGYNQTGALGDQTNIHNGSPVTVFGGLTFSSLTAGNFHTCGVSGGVGYCWGNNGNGELGDDNAPTDSNQPVTVAGGITTWVTIDAGANHSCGRTASATYCWGANYSGQLGSPGTGVFKKTPTQIIQ